METFDSVSPATGELVATFPVMTEPEVAAVVERARDAQQWWASLGFAGRKQRLRAWRNEIVARMDELAALMHREGGKPVDDALLEVVLVAEHLDWAARHASKVLRRRTVLPGLLMPNQHASIRYLPYGVVGVIGPWNYPVFTPMGSIGYALAAGNAVVFKPSEFTPAVGQWLVDSFAAAVPDEPVLQLITGLGDTGAALCRSGVDKIAFTGSGRTGRAVMAACAESLTPVLIECGGKDVVIVDEDADLDAAAHAAVWAGMSNAGQTCVGTERVYVHRAVHEELLRRMSEIARRLRPGDDAEASYGPMTMPSQVDVIRRHIADALDRGGRAVVGGVDSVRAPYVDPVVLTDVPEDSIAVTQETFGPVLVVNPVASMDEAVGRANATSYGLSAAVFSGANGERIAAALRTGMVSINSVMSFPAVGALPFGGVGESGFGRIHGADGLRELTRTQSVTKQLLPSPVALTSFDRPPSVMRVLTGAIRARFRR